MAILWKEAVLRLFHNGFYDVFSPITTERLLIRKLAIGDAEDIFKVSSDPEVSRYVLWDTHRSIADSRSTPIAVMDRRAWPLFCGKRGMWWVRSALSGSSGSTAARKSAIPSAALIGIAA